MVNVPSLGCIGFVLWVFERLVGHRIARPLVTGPMTFLSLMVRVLSDIEEAGKRKTAVEKALRYLR